MELCLSRTVAQHCSKRHIIRTITISAIRVRTAQYRHPLFPIQLATGFYCPAGIIFAPCGYKEANHTSMKTHAFVLLSVLLLSSCSHYVVNDEGYIRPPAGYKFSYRKKASQLNSTEIIDTTAIYVLQNSNVYRDSEKYKHSDNYIRFYADGRFKLQGIKKGLKLEDVNNPNSGLVGYYKLSGKAVKLQVYTDINAGSDQLEFGLINEEGNLVILDENPRTDFGIGYSEKGIRRKVSTSYRNPKVYKKTTLEGLSYIKPNW